VELIIGIISLVLALNRRQDLLNSGLSVEIGDLLNHLNERDRKIINLKIFEGKSMAEIDQEMGITNSAMYYKRAIDQLQRKIGANTLKYKQKDEGESKDSVVEQLTELDDKESRIALRIAALTGFCAMVYEVVWLRLLIPVLSSSTYSFSIILAAFITGITLGSYLTYKYRGRILHPLRAVGFAQFAIAISILLTLPFYERLPYTIWTMVSSSIGDVPGYSYYLTVQFIMVFFVLVIPTVFMGMTLPLLSRVTVKSIGKSGNSVGNIFALNTLGTVAGSLLGGLVMIPILGIFNTLVVTVLINVLLAANVFLLKDMLKRPQQILLASLLALSGIIFFTNVSTQNWAYSIMLSQVPRSINRTSPPNTYSEFIQKLQENDSILYYKEGVGGTIIVGKNREQIYLSTNGKGDANSVTDLRTQVSLGQTPVILHPNAERVFVIGYGAGTTIGNVLTHPNVKHAEVAEISEEVIEASVHFNSINEKPLTKKNLKVIKDDGVAALRLSKNTYDVIISQPSNPWSAGVGNLFTKEFFGDCKKKLNKGGYVAQWFSYYEMNDKSLKLILRTALEEFPNVSLWHIGKSDILLLCSETPFNFDLKKIEQNYTLVKDKLEKINIFTFSSFLSQQLISSTEGLRAYVGSGEINTEDHPLLELWAPQAYYYNSEPTGFIVLDERKHFSSSKLLLKKYMDEKGGLSKDEILETGLFQSLGGCKELAFYMADLNPEIYLMWAQKAMQMGDQKSAMEYVELAKKKGSVKPSEIARQKADILGSKGDYRSALNEINNAIKSNPEIAQLHYQKGTFHLSLNELDLAAQALEKAIELDPYMIDAYNNLATVKGKQQNYNAVIQILDKAVVISDKNAKVFFNRGYAKGFLSNFQGAVDDFSKALAIDPTYGQALVLRGRAYISLGKKTEACNDFTKAKNMNVAGAMESINQFCN
jgi:predicted membrane-bound spermidine synthase/tetratricopeptide (TPR) repeat protein